MKAIKARDKGVALVDIPEPSGEGIKIKVAIASICGSDLHMLAQGFFGDCVIGHEFAGYTPDGRAVAVEPTVGCGVCLPCEEGFNGHCNAGFHLLGLVSDGGMAEYVLAPARNLVELPSGLAMDTASLVEPLAVAIHGLDRARVRTRDRVLVIGAGPIGLASAAALQGRGIGFDILARHAQQQAAAQRLGAGLDATGSYDVVIDAVGSSQSLRQAVQYLKPMGRIGLVGSFWDATALDVEFCMKEAELIAASTYTCKSPQRNFEEAARLLHSNPVIADLLITHRYPLDAAAEAFAMAANRAQGAIKVVFDIA